MRRHTVRVIVAVLAGSLLAGCAGLTAPQAVPDYTDDVTLLAGVVRPAVTFGLTTVDPAACNGRALG